VECMTLYLALPASSPFVLKSSGARGLPIRDVEFAIPRTGPRYTISFGHAGDPSPISSARPTAGSTRLARRRCLLSGSGRRGFPSEEPGGGQPSTSLSRVTIDDERSCPRPPRRSRQPRRDLAEWNVGRSTGGRAAGEIAAYQRHRPRELEDSRGRASIEPSPSAPTASVLRAGVSSIHPSLLRDHHSWCNSFGCNEKQRLVLADRLREGDRVDVSAPEWGPTPADRQPIGGDGRLLAVHWSVDLRASRS